MDRVFIIAEAGVNHNGSMEIAKKLIAEASKAGVDAIKFQSFKAEDLAVKTAPKAAYQCEMTDADESQYAMLKKLELTEQMHRELIEYCKEKGILFLSSAFDLKSIDLLASFGLPIMKIPSGEITNLPYLRKIGSLKKQVILSTGMSTMEEVEAAVQILKGAGSTDIIVLHCNTEYPTPMEDVNLNVLKTLRDTLGVKVGYSDHTKGIEIPIAAVALGACVIEKHFTLDQNMEGPDHKASLEPKELCAMVKAIRNVEKALGSGKKSPSASEIKNKEIVRKSIVAACTIHQGEIFTEHNLKVKRPGTGISPMNWDAVIGKTALKNYEEDDFITYE